MSPQSVLHASAQPESLRSDGSGGRKTSTPTTSPNHSSNTSNRLNINLGHFRACDNTRVSGAPLSGARISLRKRKPVIDRSACVALTYSADFLSGIFDDIAKANGCENELHGTPINSLPFQEFPSNKAIGIHDISPEHSPRSCKKSRVSMSQSAYASRKSFVCLSNLNAPSTDVSLYSAEVDDTSSTNPFNSTNLTGNVPVLPNFLDPDQQHYLDCVFSFGQIPAECSAAYIVDEALLAFPQLPATVSESSCSSNNLNQAKAEQAAPAPGTETLFSPPVDEGNKESYGWFVEMDDDDQAHQQVIETFHATSEDLSFSAVTAPKSCAHDAEVEWAKAADTVDDVLGDFF